MMAGGDVLKAVFEAVLVTEVAVVIAVVVVIEMNSLREGWNAFMSPVHGRNADGTAPWRGEVKVKSRSEALTRCAHLRGTQILRATFRRHCAARTSSDFVSAFTMSYEKRSQSSLQRSDCYHDAQ
jgi:hypothetical protein